MLGIIGNNNNKSESAFLEFKIKDKESIMFA